MRKALPGIALLLVTVALPAAQTAFYPPAGQWARKTPAEAGMDAAKLNEAVEFMKAHETASPARDFADQEIVNGKLLASIPTERAATNGLIIRRGYIVAEFGDTQRADPTYSVAKSMLATVAGIIFSRNPSGKGRCGGRTRTSSDLRHSAAASGSRARFSRPAACTNTTTCA